MLHVRENEVSLRKWSGATAHLRSSEGRLVRCSQCIRIVTSTEHFPVCKTRQWFDGDQFRNQLIFSRGGKMIVTLCTYQLNMFWKISRGGIAWLPTPGCGSDGDRTVPEIWTVLKNTVVRMLFSNFNYDILSARNTLYQPLSLTVTKTLGGRERFKAATTPIVLCGYIAPASSK